MASNCPLAFGRAESAISIENRNHVGSLSLAVSAKSDVPNGWTLMRKRCWGINKLIKEWVSGFSGGFSALNAVD
jgi:hypothetical protein